MSIRATSSGVHGVWRALHAGGAVISVPKLTGFGLFVLERDGKVSTEVRQARIELGRQTRNGTGLLAWLAHHRAQWIAVLVLLAAVGLWDLLVRWQQYPAFILPAPAVVARKLWLVLADGSLLRHSLTTLLEIGLGLLLGLTVAYALGYWLGKHRALEQLAAPYIVASQSVPIVAIAPLLVLWLGSGLTSKVTVTALITFFPALISAIVGIRSVDPDLHDLMRSLRPRSSHLLLQT